MCIGPTPIQLKHERYTTSNRPLLLLKLRENGCCWVLYINGCLLTASHCCFVFSQIWQAWIQRSHTSETEDPNTNEIICDLETAEMNIHPDWNEAGNPGTQNIFLKQFNKKNCEVSWKIGETQSISCVSPVLVTKKHNCQKRSLSLIQILYKENVKKYFHMLKAIMLHK